MADNREIELLIGTYEDYVLGYQLESIRPGSKKRKRHQNNSVEAESNQIDSVVSLEQSFAVRSHSGSVKCLCRSADGVLAFSAGQDEMTNLFNLQRRKLLQTSESAINCALFIGNNHLVAGSESGNVHVYECKSSGYELAKTLHGHKESIVSMDAHPSGKILLSLSKDRTMRTWNLIKGRCAYVTQIKGNAHIVKWSKVGDDFLLIANNEMVVYNIDGSLRHTIRTDRRINSIEFLNDEIFVAATDSGQVYILDLNKEEPVMKFQAHQTRVKSLSCFEGENLDKSFMNLVTSSSDGAVKVWLIDVSFKSKPEEVASIDIGARITCMVSCVRKLGD